MKVVLAGAYGNLGAEVFRELIGNGHEVVALDIAQRDIGIDSGFSFTKVDVTAHKDAIEYGKGSVGKPRYKGPVRII